MRGLVALCAALALALPAAAVAASPSPRAKAEAQARVAVYNLIESSRETCPIVKWRFVSVVQGSFPGIAHPGRGAKLVKVTVEVEWAGSMFLHQDAWTVVGTKALPADTNRSTAVYRDREAAWIGNGCFGKQPFG